MSRGSNLLGGGVPGRHIKGEERLRRLAWARAWREQMRPIFDAMDAQGMFSDSPPRLHPFARRAEP